MALDDRYPYASWALAMINVWMRRHDDAIRAAENSIALNPNFANGYANRGVILHYVGRSEEALPCFERAMALDPLCPNMWLHFRNRPA